MVTNKKAVSTIILIILILCSAVFGAFLSYMWVMANFYLEPKTVGLVITNVDFPVDHADYFYVTVMNPSHSPSGTNITEIYFSVEGNDKVYNVTDTYPEALPIPLEKGTNKTIKCNRNWGEFAGKTIAVHMSATNASGAEASAETKLVKLELNTRFNATVSCKQFNVTITNNPQSAINLTLTNIKVDLVPIENASLLPGGQNVTFPINLFKGTSVSLRCLYNWEHFKNPTVRVETSEGYYAEVSTNATASVLLLITDVVFNETKPDEMSISASNSPISSTPVDVSDIVLTYRDGTQDQQYHINGNLTNPPFAPYYILDRGSTVTFNHCIWNWKNFRDQNITITVNVKQGFTPTSKTVKTPQPIVLRITELAFNLTNTECFLLTVRNMPCSLQNATITNATIVYINPIKINQTTPGIPYNLTIEETQETQTFNCTFDWSGYKGRNVTVNIYASQYNANYTITLPTVILNVTFNSNVSMQYFSINIQNNAFSTINITGINVNGTWINTTLTYPSLPITVQNAKTLLILCPLNWQLLSGDDITIVVTTSNGFEVTTEVRVP